MIKNIDNRMISNSQNSVVSTFRSINQKLDDGFTILVPKKYRWHQSQTS